MLGFDDLDLDRLDDPFVPAHQPRSYGWVIGTLVALVLAGAAGYMIFKQRSEPTKVASATPKPAIEKAPAATQAPAVVGEAVTLPPLAETDSIVREMVARL